MTVSAAYQVTNADLRAFIDAAHALGLKVILDLVYLLAIQYIALMVDGGSGRFLYEQEYTNQHSIINAMAERFSDALPFSFISWVCIFRFSIDLWYV